MSICKFCSIELPAKSMGVHVISCLKNPKYEEIRLKRIKTVKSKSSNIPVILDLVCGKCNGDFKYETYSNTKFIPKCCSRKCANSLAGSQGKKNHIKKESIRKCKECDGLIDTGKPEGRKCSKCLIKKSNKNISDVRKFRYYSRFTFDIQKYPEEFDIKLIEKYGLYSPANGNNNLFGICKDHKYSIHDGFKNKINPLILQHPANCQLLLFLDNKKKNTTSSLTLVELLTRIISWNDKYRDTPETFLLECKMLLESNRRVR